MLIALVIVSTVLAMSLLLLVGAIFSFEELQKDRDMWREACRDARSELYYYKPRSDNGPFRNGGLTQHDFRLEEPPF